jgi:hypothetical protein
VRFNYDGSVDGTFGVGGVAGLSTSLKGMETQADGKSVVAGGIGSEFAIERHDLNGGLDPSFGAGGRVTTGFSTSFASAFALAIQSDGKIVAAGSVGCYPSSEFALARYIAAPVDNGGAEPVVAGLRFDSPTTVLGGRFTAMFSGTNLTDGTYFDLRVQDPVGADEVVLNWQQGTVAVHDVPANTTPGIWKVAGVRAHRRASDHSAPFTSVSAALTVTSLVAGLPTRSRTVLPLEAASRELTPLFNRWMPPPRVLHPYPDARFAAMHPVRDVCVNALVRICAGASSNRRPYRDIQKPNSFARGSEGRHHGYTPT